MFIKNKSFKLEIKIIFILIKIYFIIITLFLNDKTISNIKFIFFYFRTKFEVNNFKSYYNFCNENTKIIKDFKKSNNIKVSIISPIHNREKFLLTFLKSIQFQDFKDIEIILVDDKSTDNGINIIEEYIKKDKRIKLIKNKKNKGTFVARNIGVLSSKGKYIMIPDPDDILSQDIIKNCYNYAEKYNYDVIKFRSYSRNRININDYYYKFENRPIYQPELSTFVFYDNNELRIRDYVIHNKFVKREIFIKVINSLNSFYSNMYITLGEDTLIFYLILRKANSFYFLKKVGYYYIRSSESICANLFKITDLRMKFSFIFLKCFFENSRNTKYEKDIVNHIIGSNLESQLLSSPFNDNFYFYYDIINMLLDCTYIENNNIYILKKYKKIIENKNQTYVKLLKKIEFNNTLNSLNKTKIK